METMRNLSFRISFKIKLFRINLSQWFARSAQRAPLLTLFCGLSVIYALGVLLMFAAFKAMEPFFVAPR